MLRIIIIVAAAIGIPATIWFASQYGQLKEVMFKEAEQLASSSTEGEQSPKVIILSVLHKKIDEAHYLCTDQQGTDFTALVGGLKQEKPFVQGMTVRFVGHVHPGSSPEFHAMQVYYP